MTTGSVFRDLLPLATAEQMRRSGSFKWSLGVDLPCFVAEMDFQPAPEIRRALAQWAQEGWLGYLPPAVLHDFRSSIVDYYATLGHRQDLHLVRPVSDLVTLFDAVIRHFLAPNDPIVLLTPTYMNFVTAAEKSGHPVRTVDMIRNLDSAEWNVDWPRLEASLSDGGLLVLINPHNPIGKSYSQAELKRIAAIAQRSGARVLADEIHAPLTYEPTRHIPFASTSEQARKVALTAFSVTKAFSIPGTKAAALLLTNESDLHVWQDRCLHLEFGTATAGMIATTAALKEAQGWFADALTYLADNRQQVSRLVKQHLPEAIYLEPEATYLAWLDLRGTPRYNSFAKISEATLARNIARQTGVLATDGLECGEAGNGHIRINYATHHDNLEEIFRRLGEALG